MGRSSLVRLPPPLVMGGLVVAQALVKVVMPFFYKNNRIFSFLNDVLREQSYPVVLKLVDNWSCFKFICTWILEYPVQDVSGFT